MTIDELKQLLRGGAMDIPQACAHVNLRERTFLKLVDAGEIPCIRIGKLYRFLADDLDAWMRQKSSDKSSDTLAETRRPQVSPDDTSPPPIPLKKRAPRLNFQEKHKHQAR